MYICGSYQVSPFYQPKYEAALKHADSVAVVTPDWVLDCIESNKLVDVKAYSPTHLKPTEEQSSCNGNHNTATFQLARETVSMAMPSRACGPLASHCNGGNPALATPNDPLATSNNGGDPIVTPNNEDVDCDMAVGTEEIFPATTHVLEQSEPGVLPGNIEPMPPQTGGIEDPRTLTQMPVMEDRRTLTQMPVMEDPRTLMADVALPVEAEAVSSEQPPPQPLPQLLQGLVFVVKGYQEHLDEGTVRKWKEVRRGEVGVVRGQACV